MNTYRRMTAVTVLFLLCNVLSSHSLLFAQTRGSGGRGGQRKAGGSSLGREGIRTAEYDTAPFDITRDKLPPLYLGHSVQFIYDAIIERKKGSGSPAEIKARNAGTEKSATALPLTGTLNFDSVYAFQVVPAENAYNTHDQTFQSYCPLSTVLARGVEDTTRKGIMLAYVPQLDNHYRYTDNKGKQIEIEEVKFRDYMIVFKNVNQFSAEKAVLLSVQEVAEKEFKNDDTSSRSDVMSEKEMIIGRFKLPSAEAKQFKDRVRMLAICQLVDPYVTSEIVQRTSTPEKPSDYLAQHQYLHVRLVALWFYDPITGKVLLKMRPDDIHN